MIGKQYLRKEDEDIDKQENNHIISRGRQLIFCWYLTLFIVLREYIIQVYFPLFFPIAKKAKCFIRNDRQDLW